MTGSSSATVIAGPMPGSTPTAVPSSTPMKANSRLVGCQRGREAVEEQAEVVHQMTACRTPLGR